MKPSRSVFLSAIALVIIALVPLRAYAATPPRVVALGDLASKPVEVAITSKHLTLIHFETGEVSMVAVGDPGIVSVTVKGADVLLKALTSSGSTNAFIWQGGRYTQWTFTVRQNSKDPRLIIVKDLAASAGTGVQSRKNAEGTGEGGKQVTGSTWAATVTRQAATETVATSAATASAPPPLQQQSVRPAKGHAETAGAAQVSACGSSASLHDFVKTLNAKQRELFSGFLTQSSLARLKALLLELKAQQRCNLLALLAAPASSAQPRTGAFASIAPVSAPSITNAHETNHAPDRTTGNSCGSAPQWVWPTGEAQEGSLVAEAVVFSVTPAVIDGQPFLYYVLENRGKATLLTDILRLRIFDGSGKRLTFRISRASQGGYLGRLETNSAEYGVIAVDASEKLLVLEWKLIGLRSGAEQLVRVDVQVP